MRIFCVACKGDIEARLANGAEIYPHREDLHELPFWKCDECKNYVGCHHKTKNRTRPLGNIPTKELRNARRHIHGILDPLWQTGSRHRSDIYNMISQKIGWRYHTANIRSIDEAREVYKIVMDIVKCKENAT